MIFCWDGAGSYQCYCRPGFSGSNCNLEFDECLSHPCNNNGSCNNLINGYECVCAAGFAGKDCDTNINECESSPCQNDATCIDAVAAFTCICLPGFTGQRCQVNIDECQVPIPSTLRAVSKQFGSNFGSKIKILVFKVQNFSKFKFEGQHFGFQRTKLVKI